LRELRAGRRLTLKDVAGKSGVSPSFLSQVERGVAAPSLRTLQAIAHALGLEVGDLFVDDGAQLPHLVPAKGRPVLGVGSLTKFRVTPVAVTQVEVIGGVFEPGGTAGDEEYVHGDSDEVFVVVRGSVRAAIEGEKFDLEAGDALCYRSSMPHTFHNVSESESEVLWILSPPSW